MRFGKYLYHHLISLHGWRTNRKIVVIESDDWGSIRMPSTEVYEQCLRAGYPVDQIAYERYDSLLSQSDLELLFDLLIGFKDKNGRTPIITANCVVANPDFNKIEGEGYKKYYFELITDTFRRYPNHEKNFSIWLAAKNNGVFFPQYHAREHLNVSKFMDALQNKDPDALWAIKHRMPGSIPKGPQGFGNIYVESTAYDSEYDKIEKLNIYLEGLDLFEKLFGYNSESIIPPNYIWSSDFDAAVYKKGVIYFQGNRKMKELLIGGESQIHTHYLGQSNILGQIYLIRNTLFEPSMFRFNIKDPVDRCLLDISIAFRMRKPAIISSHRLNYVGFLDIKNRDKNLRMLKQVLSKALTKWPDIEFMSSASLGAMIRRDKKIEIDV